MSTSSMLETTTSLHNLSNRSLIENKKLNKIKSTLFNFTKEEITSFSSLKVKIYKEEIEEEKDENKIKIPESCKNYFEDYRKYKGVLNNIESGINTKSNNDGSIKDQQIDSSDLVNSE